MGNVVVKPIFGHVELKSAYRMEGKDLVYYGWSIRYDKDGIEVERAKPSAYGRILGCDEPINKPWWRFWKA